MKKIIYSLIVVGLLISCGKSIESDAKTIADLMCKSQKDLSNTSENLNYVEEIEKIEAKYEGEEKEKLEKLAEELYIKQCGNNAVSDFLKSSEKDTLQEGETVLSSDPNLNEDDYNIQSSTNNDYDKMLDDYEKYVDQYLVVYKKAMNGDQSAMIEYPELLSKAQEFEKSMQLADRGGDLSVQQLKRMNDINFKMLGAMQN
ncbi:hypothetical protein SAMN05421786_104240 [Chryseobacterium ureilyticum]|uniref:Lipoprotein n=1 Tax=Chryseobacterium ureilyticum TaxID=373668 RepID=A0A1N7P068_9FLAO|nr:hypothetical protein [Chryseobacterium ureilyticum]SIT03982.1 hypothetical protein SAMN05421786_104240 [Chryseobacterium ureilyticum]